MCWRLICIREWFQRLYNISERRNIDRNCRKVRALTMPGWLSTIMSWTYNVFIHIWVITCQYRINFSHGVQMLIDYSKDQKERNDWPGKCSHIIFVWAINCLRARIIPGLIICNDLPQWILRVIVIMRPTGARIPVHVQSHQSGPVARLSIIINRCKC